MSYDVTVIKPPVPSGDSGWASLRAIVDEGGPTDPALADLHRALHRRFPDEPPESCVWIHQPLEAFRGRSASLPFRSRDAGDVLPFLVREACSRGLLVFDAVTRQVHHPGPARGHVLTVENEVAVPLFAAETVSLAVDRLGKGGPRFMIIDGPNGSYAQAAGGPGGYTAEWYVVEKGTARHAVAGLPGRGAEPDVAISMGETHVTVRGNERLTAHDVKDILRAFVEGSAKPARFTWRSVAGG